MKVKRFFAIGMAVAALAVQGADEYLVRSMSRGICNRWLTGGEMAGKVLVRDDFTDAKKSAALWEFIGSTSPVELEGGLKALEIRPHATDYSGFRLRRDKLIRVRPGAQYVVNWRTRSPEGGRPILFSVCGLDANFKEIRPYQVRSQVAYDQPGLFHRNVLFASEHLTPDAVYLQIRFVCARSQADDARRGYVTDLAITDISDEVNALVAALPPTGDYRAKAGEKEVLVNVSDDLCGTFPTLPDAQIVPGKPGDPLAIRACAGERVRATAILWTKTARSGVTLAFSPLRGKAGEIPASALSAKVVKCHYQADGAPDLMNVTGPGQVLVPELLVHDDGLVKADHDKRHTLVKFSFPDGAKYVDINAIKPEKWMHAYPAKDFPIVDAKTLQPFELPARECKQLVFAIEVPEDAKPGVYKGEIAYRADGGTIARTEVLFEVLPFELPTAETVYSPAQEYTMGLYVWGDLQAEGEEPVLSLRHKSREQMLGELRNLVMNGVDHPILIWHRESVVLSEANLRRHLDVAREAGLKGTLYLGSSDDIGNPTSPEKLAKLKEDVNRIQAVAKEYGFNEVYFYGLDEVVGDKLLSQRAAWKAVHEAGGKIIVSGYQEHFAKVGDLLDLIVYSDDPETERPVKWHGVGHKIWKYNTPQAGIENPYVLRRNYGLYIWSLGYDGASTYAFNGESLPWNDLASPQRHAAAGTKSGFTYRSLSFGYGTVDGTVETIEMTGLHDAIKDVRYMTKFRQLLRRTKDPEAQAWYDSLDFKNGDLVKIRRQTVNWIKRLMRSGR